MMPFFPGRAGAPLNVLCLGAHSDDIEIGCGGTILEIARRYPDSRFHWVVLTAAGIRQSEAACAARLFTSDKALESTTWKTFRDGFLPYNGADVKNVFEELKTRISPDLILTHSGLDAHQDHRLVCELTWNTFRNHTILEYEIPKYDGDLGRPNVFVPLDRETCEGKVERLLTAFASQRSKAWFTPETFMGLMRLRGMECNSPSGYAEAFYARKLMLSLE